MDGNDYDRRQTFEPMEDGRRMDDLRRATRHTVRNARQQIVSLTERLEDEGRKVCEMLRAG